MYPAYQALDTTNKDFNMRTVTEGKIRAVITLSLSQFHTTLMASVTVFLALVTRLVSENRTMKSLEDHAGCKKTTAL